GVGFGLIGELRNMAAQGLHQSKIIGVNVADKPTNALFLNLRAQLWWDVGRISCEQHLWDLSSMENADTTCAQLLAPRWKLNAKGLIQVEPKADVIARLGRSPDNADALLLAFYSPQGTVTNFLDQLIAAKAAGP